MWINVDVENLAFYMISPKPQLIFGGKVQWSEPLASTSSKWVKHKPH
jgi:hypothetical protein